MFIMKNMGEHNLAKNIPKYTKLCKVRDALIAFLNRETDGVSKNVTGTLSARD